MAYRFEVGEAVGDALRRVVAEEVVAAENSLALVLASQSPEAVHDVRKRTKKLRAEREMSATGARCWWRAKSLPSPQPAC